MERDVQQGSRRDLFAFAKSGEGAAEAAPVIAPAPESAEVALQKPDPLSAIQVLGLVRRPNSATVLVKLGTSLLEVPLGKPFAEGDLLIVRSIEGPNVVIEDRTSKNSRTFTLSEE